MTDRRELVLARIDYLQAELHALAALLRIHDPSTSASPLPDAAAAAPEELPAEPEPKPKVARRKPAPPTVDPSTFTIDPARAATILGVTRQTVDRRLHDGVPANVAGRPHNVGRGGVRARWRWRSEDDVRAWWAAIR